MNLPSVEQIAGWTACAVAMFGLIKGWVAYWKEHSFGRTLADDLKKRMETVERVVDESKKDRETLHKELDALDDKLDNILYDIIKKL